MHAPSAHLINRLDRLIRLCKEASYEYNLAADRVQDEAVRTTLQDAVASHAVIARELEEHITACDTRGDVGLVPAVPEEGLWTELGRAATAMDESAIVEVCERGQRQLQAAFVSTAAEPDITPETATLLRHHTETLAELHHRLEQLRSAAGEQRSNRRR